MILVRFHEQELGRQVLGNIRAACPDHTPLGFMKCGRAAQIGYCVCAVAAYNVEILLYAHRWIPHPDSIAFTPLREPFVDPGDA